MGFKPRGSQPREEVAYSKENNGKTVDKKATRNEGQSEVEELKKQLAEAQGTIQNLKSSKRSFTKNEEKILNAIRSEKINQDIPKPLISNNMFRKKYKVHAKYQRDSIESLLRDGIIIQEEAIYSGRVKTSAWDILEQ